MTQDTAELAAFLHEAKRRTYAGLDDDATVAAPLLAGSKQLDYEAGPYAYRDIYFGMAFFVGQETVTRDGKAIWSMSYSGGVLPEITDRATLLSIYRFLRQALLAARIDSPYRGPASFTLHHMLYRNVVAGGLVRFHGHEEILDHGRPVFDLHYSGGLLR